MKSEDWPCCKICNEKLEISESWISCPKCKTDISRRDRFEQFITSNVCDKTKIIPLHTSLLSQGKYSRIINKVVKHRISISGNIIHDIVTAYANSFGVEMTELFSKKRKMEIILPKHLSVYSLMMNFGFSPTELSRDTTWERTSLYNSQIQGKNLIDTEPKLKRLYNHIIRVIQEKYS